MEHPLISGPPGLTAGSLCDTPGLTAGSICTGIGALDLAAERVLGPLDLRFVAEIDAEAASLLHRRFFRARNVGSISTVDWAPYGSPELLTMGIPCQAVSLARGAQATAFSERWLWPQARRAISELRPERVFFENVKGLLSVDGGQAWEQVLADLVHLGYGVRWLTIGACAVGAPHHRHRVFLLAQRSSEPKVSRVEVAECGASPEVALLPTLTAREGSHRGAGTPEFWATRQRENRQGKESPPLSAVIGILADGQRPGEAFWFREFEPAVRRWALVMGPAPYPLFEGPGGGRRLHPRFGEWLLGLRRDWSSIHSVTRREQLRLLGNSVCLPQAVRALELLCAEEREPPPPAPLAPRPVRQKEVSGGVMHATRLPEGVSERLRAEAARRGLKPAQLARQVLSEFVEGLG